MLIPHAAKSSSKISTSVKAPNISTLYPNSIIFLNLLRVLYTQLASLSLTFQSDILFFLKNSLNKVTNMNTVTRARNICSPSLTGFHKCHRTMYIHTVHRLYTGINVRDYYFNYMYITFYLQSGSILKCEFIK